MENTKGSKWRILGDNGTGKTTLLSIITADHPQSWKSVIKVNGILRKTGSGVTFFDINNKIGISSPELHALVPQHNKTMKDIIYNGLVKNVGNSNFISKVILIISLQEDKSIYNILRTELINTEIPYLTN